jgi:hypothetical protein
MAFATPCIWALPLVAGPKDGLWNPKVVRRLVSRTANLPPRGLGR